MKHERNDLKAGIFILLSVAALIAIVIGIKGLGALFDPGRNAEAAFDLTMDIGGLKVGNDVRLGGYKVGAVRDIAILDPVTGRPQPRIVVRFTLPAKYDLRHDARIVVQTSVTGASVINIENLGEGAAYDGSTPLAGDQSGLTALAGMLSRMSPDLGAILSDVRTKTVPKVNTTLDTFNTTGSTTTDFVAHAKTKIDPIVDRYNTVSDKAGITLERGGEAATEFRDLIGPTKDDFKTTVANLSAATGTIKDELPKTLQQDQEVLAKLSTGMDSATDALVDIRKIASNTRDLTGSAKSIVISNRGKIDEMIATLTETSKDVKRGVNEITRNPWRVLYKPDASERNNLRLYDTARDFADGASQLNTAAIALRDGLKSQDLTSEDIAALVSRLDVTFAKFNEIESELWNKIKE